MNLMSVAGVWRREFEEEGGARGERGYWYSRMTGGETKLCTLHEYPVVEEWAGAVVQKPLKIQEYYQKSNQPTDQQT